MDYQIETNVEIPRLRTKGSRGIIRKLAVAPIGASVFFPNSTRNSIISAAFQTFGKVEGGFRIWKIAEPQTVEA
jgi:hypothetical protein